MTSIEITDEDFAPLKDKIIIISGGSSGIGLATVKLLLAVGAKVVVGDVNPLPVEAENLLYQHVDVTDWTSQLQLFKKTISIHGRIDHVFANAGVTSYDNYMGESVDANGDPLPPKSKTLDVNLTGVIYTCKLGIFYLKQNPLGGSVVITSSPAAIGPFPLSDYCVSKHAVLGLMRALDANCASRPDNKIRVNCLNPLFTITGMVSQEHMAKAGVKAQSPEAVARSAAMLMADESRHGQAIASKRGQYYELNEALLGAAYAIYSMDSEDAPLHDPTVAAQMFTDISAWENL